MLWRTLTNLVLDRRLKLRGSADIEFADGTRVTQTEFGKLTGLTPSTAELNRTNKASTRIVVTTATVLALTVTQHAEKVVLVQSNSTVANTLTLPVATGSGVKMTIINDIAQTQGSVVVAANGTTDVLSGTCYSVASTASGALTFRTSATSDKVSMNKTTTGGLGGDVVEVYDKAANTWNVTCNLNCSGSLATPFSES